jgi:hypothetical protein
MHCMSQGLQPDLLQCSPGKLTIVSLGNLRLAVPEGRVRIAQRFNAGMGDEGCRVPKGRLTNSARVLPFIRPFGTYAIGTAFPALKRRVIVRSPSGTTLQLT